MLCTHESLLAKRFDTVLLECIQLTALLYDTHTGSQRYTNASLRHAPQTVHVHCKYITFTHRQHILAAGSYAYVLQRHRQSPALVLLHCCIRCPEIQICSYLCTRGQRKHSVTRAERNRQQVSMRERVSHTSLAEAQQLLCERVCLQRNLFWYSPPTGQSLERALQVLFVLHEERFV